MLILHSTTLLNLFISSARFFLVDSLGFFYIQNHLIDSLLLTSQSRCLLFFSCLTAVARTSSTILNRSGNGGHLCLIPDVQEKAFSLSPQSMMLAIACLCFKTSALNWYHYETSPRRKGYHTKCSVYKNEHRKKDQKKTTEFFNCLPWTTPGPWDLLSHLCEACGTLGGGRGSLSSPRLRCFSSNMLIPAVLM